MAKFYQTIVNFPKQVKKGIEIAKDIKLEGSFENIIFSGIGGSIIPAEIFLSYIQNSDPKLLKRIQINRDYDLPKFVTKKDLLICISWSGNTKETISSYQAGRKLGLKILVITKGGELAELAKENKDNLILLPEEKIPPRFAFGFIFSSLLTVLINSNIMNFPLENLKKIANSLNLEELKKIGENLSQKIKINKKIPLIYSSYQNRYLASFWKIKFNENAKIHSFYNYFPNLAHNEIAGFELIKDPIKQFVILLFDSGDDQRTKNKIKIMEEILKEIKIDHEIVELKGESRLEKIFNNYILSDFTTCFVAENLGVDPFEANIIEKFKELEDKICWDGEIGKRTSFRS